jgi:FkbM family methyltransferase
LAGSIRLDPQAEAASGDWPTVKFETQIEVPIVRLDDWALDKNLGNIDLVCADTQGAESDLVAGGASAIRSARWLFIEYGVIEYYEGQVSRFRGDDDGVGV